MNKERLDRIEYKIDQGFKDLTITIILLAILFLFCFLYLVFTLTS